VKEEMMMNKDMMDVAREVALKDMCLIWELVMMVVRITVKAVMAIVFKLVMVVALNIVLMVYSENKLAGECLIFVLLIFFVFCYLPITDKICKT